MDIVALHDDGLTAQQIVTEYPSLSANASEDPKDR
jgi:uncharacterized protein (DUF433 family)